MPKMTARYNGTCKCGGRIRRGDSIDYNRATGARHIDCANVPVDDDDPFAKTRSRGYYGRDAGRCEDAPCCGCC